MYVGTAEGMITIHVKSNRKQKQTLNTATVLLCPADNIMPHYTKLSVWIKASVWISARTASRMSRLRQGWHILSIFTLCWHKSVIANCSDIAMFTPERKYYLHILMLFQTHIPFFNSFLVSFIVTISRQAYLFMWQHWRNDTLLQCKVVSVQLV